MDKLWCGRFDTSSLSFRIELLSREGDRIVFSFPLKSVLQDRYSAIFVYGMISYNQTPVVRIANSYNKEDLVLDYNNSLLSFEIRIESTYSASKVKASMPTSYWCLSVLPHSV